VLVYRVKDGKHQDAEEFLRLFLNALNEELVALHTYISTHKPVSAPSVEGPEEEAQAGGVVKQDYTVRRLLFLSEPTLTLLTYGWTRIGKSNRVARLSPIRRKVPFDRTRAKPARHRHRRKLAITSTQHPGSFLHHSPSSIMTNIRTLCPARFGTHNSGLTRTHLAATTLTGRPFQFNRGNPASANRGASARSCPPS
jgi:hypothetical protein